MHRKTISIIALISMFGGIIAYGYSDFIAWSKQYPNQFFEIMDLLFSFAICLIVAIGMWFSSKFDEIIDDEYQFEDKKEEIRQKLIYKDELKNFIANPKN